MGRLTASVLLGGYFALASGFALKQYVVVVSAAENDAMKLALQDLDRDLYTVTGSAAVTLNAPPTPGSLPTGTAVIYFGTLAAAPWLSSFALPPTCLEGWEAHCVVSVPAGGPGSAGYQSIVATGVGVRGAIYGAYTFSDAVLGFKPLFLFTDTPAAYAGPQGLWVDDNITIVFTPPKFDYRATFINDEDLTGGRFADPYAKNVFDLTAWDTFFQATLRMKANAVLVGTNPFPDDSATALAARRGLVISHHHYDLLGGNVFSWPLPADDWTWDQDAGTMSLVWKAAIAAQSGYPEVAWSVGLRGLNDVAYPGCSPITSKNAQYCGETISYAIGNQTKWVKSLPNQANATLILYMWQELLDLLSSGYLTVPEGVSVVFTDAGSGYVRTDANWTQYSEGCYYHTAMLDGTANQLTEMVPVSRVIEQLLGVINASKATKVFVDNISDLKPVPMTTSAVYDLVWDPTPWNATRDYNASARAWYAKFGQDYCLLAPADASTYATLWEAYFNVPYIFGGSSDNLLAQSISQVATSIAADWATGTGVTQATVTSATNIVARLGGAGTLSTLSHLNSSAWALAAAVPRARMGFYVSHTLMQFNLQLACVQALVLLQSAAVALSPPTPGGPVPDPASALSMLQAASSGLEFLKSLRHATEGDAGAWTGLGIGSLGPVVNIGQAYPNRALYLYDTLSDIEASYGAIQTCMIALGQPAQAPLFPIRASSWYKFEAYQKEVTANYPLVNFNPQYNMPTYVRSNCRVSDVANGTCLTSPDGGWFIQGSSASLTLQIMTSQTEPLREGEMYDGPAATRQAMRELQRLGLASSDPVPGAAALAIYYSTDGSMPTPSSPAYMPGQSPRFTDLAKGQASVTVKAMAWIDGVPTGQVTTTVWNAH